MTCLTCLGRLPGPGCPAVCPGPGCPAVCPGPGPGCPAVCPGPGCPTVRLSGPEVATSLEKLWAIESGRESRHGVRKAGVGQDGLSVPVGFCRSRWSVGFCRVLSHLTPHHTTGRAAERAVERALLHGARAAGAEREPTGAPDGTARC